MTAERGFATAKALLKEHFRDETKITAAYMDKVHNWPVVKVGTASKNGCMSKEMCLWSNLT